MERIQRTVDIELTKEECQILYEAEKLLKEMKREIHMIDTPLYTTDKQKITDCVDKFTDITSRYSIHVKLGVD